MKIEIEVSEKNEATSAPWWVIINPQKNLHSGERGATNISAMITGPFFSRIEAETVLEGRRYYYGKKALVYCMSGYGTIQYASKVRF